METDSETDFEQTNILHELISNNAFSPDEDFLKHGVFGLAREAGIELDRSSFSKKPEVELVLDLIKRAQNQGKIPELLEAIRKYNPKAYSRLVAKRQSKPSGPSPSIAEVVEFSIVPVEGKSSKPSIQSLTPDYLGNVIVPYLNAIAELQYIINEIKDRPHKSVEVRSIRQGSALISLEGVTEAIELIMSIIVPWRYKHTQTMAKLKEKEKQIQIEKARAEILASRKQLAQGKDKEKAELDLAKQRAEIKRMELENEKLYLELHREKIQLALDILDGINSNLAEAEKIDYVMKLLKPLETFILSDFEPKLLMNKTE